MGTVTDLLGLSMSSSAAPAKAPQPPAASSSSQDLLGLNSEFSAFVSASPAPAVSTKPCDPAPQTQAEVPTPSDGRLSKDSILALFGPKSSPAPAAQNQSNMFGQFQSPAGSAGMNQFQSQLLVVYCKDSFSHQTQGWDSFSPQLQGLDNFSHLWDSLDPRPPQPQPSLPALARVDNTAICWGCTISLREQ